MPGRYSPESLNMSEKEIIAAHLVYLFAVLSYSVREIDHEYGWYGWCVDKYAELQEKDKFAATVLWTLRMEEEEPDEDWAGYVEYKCSDL